MRSDAPGAIAALERCLSRRPEWVEAQINIGLAYKQTGETEKAARSFECALAAKADSVEALRGLAALAIEKQDQQRALDLQGKLIDLGERSPELFYNTGLLLQKSGQVEDAIRLYKEALAERPNFAEALLNLGHALKAKGQQEEARGYWRQALEAKPELAQGYFEPVHN